MVVMMMVVMMMMLMVMVMAMAMTATDFRLPMTGSLYSDVMTAFWRPGSLGWGVSVAVEKEMTT